MSELPTTIFLHDLVLALKELQPADQETRQAIANILGFQLEDAQAPQIAELPPLVPMPKPSAQPVQAALETPTHSLPPLAQEPNWVESNLEHSPPVTLKPLSFQGAPLPAQSASEETPFPLPFEPLFVPSWTRDILSLAVATVAEDGSPDVDNLVEQLARGECIRTIPRLPLLTLRRGVQLLIDKSASMIPFARDQYWLHQEILHVVGAEKVETLFFIGSPFRGAGIGPKKCWKRHHPPLPGVTVLLLTDLGIGRPLFSSSIVTVSEWMDFADWMHHCGCSLVALVPYRLHRCPPPLLQKMAVILWDRETTVNRIRNMIKQTIR